MLMDFYNRYKIVCVPLILYCTFHIVVVVGIPLGRYIIDRDFTRLHDTFLAWQTLNSAFIALLGGMAVLLSTHLSEVERRKETWRKRLTPLKETLTSLNVVIRNKADATTGPATIDMPDVKAFGIQAAIENLADLMDRDFLDKLGDLWIDLISYADVPSSTFEAMPAVYCTKFSPPKEIGIFMHIIETLSNSGMYPDLNRLDLDAISERYTWNRYRIPSHPPVGASGL